MVDLDLTTRKAEPADAAALCRILNPIIATGLYTVLDEPFSIDAERRYIESFPERRVFRVAVLPVAGSGEGRIVGMQSIEPFASYTAVFDHVGVLGTYVDLAERRRGIGMRLAEDVFTDARAAGYEKLFTYVRADNPGALAFHSRLGFRVVGVAGAQAKIGDRYVDEVIVEKSL
ncbi:MAG: histone acetyltransferase [Actinobacteria bacterium RBG_16_64_13]|nr:MAG: histone acetyltransferase [Actinobacteria bacterium RBG_16_64_13]